MCRRSAGNPQDDMISCLTQVTYEALGRKLTDLEVNGIVYAMIIGGLETTQYALEEQAQLLCERARSVCGSSRAIAEHLRQFTEEAHAAALADAGPVHAHRRGQDEVFQGVHVPKGSLLHLRWAAGNVDPDEWECPYELQLDRKAVTRHLAFSQVRACVPAPACRASSRRSRGTGCSIGSTPRVRAGNTFKHQPGIMLGTLELKLKFTRAG